MDRGVQLRAICGESVNQLAALSMCMKGARGEIIGLLAQRPASVSEICVALGLEISSISHHLAFLRKAGRVRYEQAGLTHLYQLTRATEAEIVEDHLLITLRDGALEVSFRLPI